MQAHNNGMRDSIFTLYELRNGENTVGEGTHRTHTRKPYVNAPLTELLKSSTVWTCAS